MKKVVKIFYILFSVIALLLLLSSTLSILINTENRYLKYLDFPRIQYFIASIILIVIALLSIKKWRWNDYLIGVSLLCVLLINGFYLINYTVLVSTKVYSTENIKTTDCKISLLISNVKMSNTNSKLLLDLIKLKKPNVLLVMEVNKRWNDELKVLNKDYPYSQRAINEVTYGMILFSKFPLQNVEVNYLQNKNVPSFNINISIENDKIFSFHAVHPVPPTHFKKLPDNEGQREKALKKLGQSVMNGQFPTIVAGDFNDVVWSRVDDLMGTTNILNDVRVGRGFYNSFDATNFLIRWPLDHVFVTKEFRLKKLERLTKIGSDHFPIFVELVF
jgi:endonuclease/exonuclease/phosphatase (EEP) superfamily protein YafD